MKLKFYEKPNCTTCRKAKAFLTGKGADLESIDLNKGLTVDQLETIIGKRDYRRLLNSRNVLYREMKMKDGPPPRDKAIKLMSENPNLIKRPIVRKGNKIVFGFDEKALTEIL
ncbi:MAG: glutaredoxin domain-containing protein [Acidobacteria bacterium]|nr:glutaredoxin domain-containing protein [Acidobacteriota bacterium]